MDNDILAKFLAKNAPEKIDISMVESVTHISDNHSQELNEFWQLTTPDQRTALMYEFVSNLQNEWKREYIELSNQLSITEIKTTLLNLIKSAYAAGYMYGKGMISTDEFTNYNLFLGDLLVLKLKNIKKNIKSRGLGFAVPFSAVGAIAHLATVKKH